MPYNFACLQIRLYQKLTNFNLTFITLFKRYQKVKTVTTVIYNFVKLTIKDASKLHFPVR